MVLVNAEQVRAGINLHAVLRSLEDLSALDPDAAALCRGHNLAIRFRVPGIDPLSLLIGDSDITAERSTGPGGLKLLFSSPRHFNRFIAGHALPLPAGGLSHLTFLKNNFAALANMLERTLRPGAEDLRDAEFRGRNTRLTAATALFALSEIANLDPLGQQIARAMGDGALLLEAPGDLAFTVESQGGRLLTKKGAAPDAQAFMRFDSLDTLGRVLRGETDSYLCVGRGQIAVSGRIPMVDNLNKLLRLTGFYLK